MHTIWEDLLEDTSFCLYAIHSNLEDYAMAYHLNLACGLRLRRSAEDVALARQMAFPCFQWDDRAHYREWTLFCNQAAGTVESAPDGLFPAEQGQQQHYLVPEKKTVDYFLKLEGEAADPDILESLRNIPKVITAYGLEPSALKSKRNLIL